MSNYTKTTDFDVKDSLPSGDTGKIIRGSEFEVEFENIEVAIASKADSLNTVLTGNTSATNLSVTGNTTLGSDASDTVTISGDVAVDTNTLFVDVSEDRVGINTSSPATALDVNGTVTANGLTVDGATELSGLFSIEGSQPSIILKETDTTDVNTFLANSSGDFSIRTVTEAGAATIRFNLDHATGDISFYEDTGTTPKLFWDASAESLGIGTDSPWANLSILADAGGTAKVTFGGDTNSSRQQRFHAYYEDVNQTFNIASFSSPSTVADIMTFNTSGNVGIGTDAPEAALDVNGDFILRDTGFPRMTFIDSDGTNTRTFLDHSSGTFSITAQNDTANGAIDFKAFDGSTTTTRMSINSTGNVGIGTSSPTSVLHVNRPTTEGLVAQFDSAGSTARTLQLSSFNSGAAGSGWNFNAASTGGVFTFSVNSDEKVRINTDGNVGIGTSNPSDLLDISANGTSAMRLSDSSSPATYAQFSQANGVLTLSADAGNSQTGSNMQFEVDGSEAMRIDSSGNLLVGTTSDTPTTGGVVIKPQNGSGRIFLAHDTGTSSGDVFALFRYASNNIGSITQDGTTGVLYNTSSDVRLKENITDAPEGNVDVLQVRSFDWKADGSHQEYGFIAQELEAVAPYAVTKGETEDDMWGVDYSKLVPMLVKEIQDLKARIATLEAN